MTLLTGIEPVAIAADQAGTIFFINAVDENQIVTFDPDSGGQNAVSLSISRNEGLLGMAIGTDGDLWVTQKGNSGEGSGRLLRIDPDTGGVSTSATGGLLWVPRSVTRDANGHAVLVDSGQILRIDPETGDQTVVADGGRPDHSVTFGTTAIAIVPVPEPASAPLLALGFLGLALTGRGRARSGRRVHPVCAA